MARVLSKIVGLFAVVVFGCGGTSGDGSDATTQLRNLSGDVAQRLCVGLSDTVNNVFSENSIQFASCLLQGLEASGTGGDCLETFSKCRTTSPLDKTFADVFPDVDLSCENFVDELANCTATIDEFSACSDSVVKPFTEMMEQLTSDVESETCSASLQEFGGFQIEDMGLFESVECRQMLAQCPNLKF